MTWRHSVVLLCALCACSCGGDTPTSPTDTVAAVSTSTVTFEGTLEPDQSRFYSFNAQQSGSVTVTLASLTLAGRRDALGIPVRIGVGIPKGEVCDDTISIEATPALVSQLSTTLDGGIHCVNIADTGHLPGGVIFLIRFTHP
jgi:hypothetical protein